MLTLDEALARVLEAVIPLHAEDCDLDAAEGRCLAEDASSRDDVPPCATSAMDGYALASNELGMPPFRLRVSGESRAGRNAPALEAGHATRIFTGAPVPQGADCVVIQENVRREGDHITFDAVPKPSQNIRRAGEDVRRGALVLERGTRLFAFETALLAALDYARVRVAKRPSVSIVVCGDELRAPGSPGSNATLPESNTLALRTLVRQAGGSVRSIERVGDDRAAIEQALKAAFGRDDVVIGVGGASVGDHDLMQQAFVDAGGMIDFWKVKIKPGKPLMFGSLAQAKFLGLPGNPVSAEITGLLFLVPLLLAMQGVKKVSPERNQVRLGRELRQSKGRLGLYRARLQGEVAWVHEHQASGSVASLAHADALVLMPAESELLEAGSSVEIIRLPKPWP